MKKIIYFLAILIFFFISCNNKQKNNFNSTNKTSKEETIKSAIPIFDFQTLKDLLVKNPKKIILLNFWATWCGACREEIPDLIQFYDEYKDKIILIGLCLDKSEENIKNFIKLAKINFPIYKADDQLTRHFMVQTIPATYIFKNGKFIDMHIGPYYYADLKRDINILEKQKVK